MLWLRPLIVLADVLASIDRVFMLWLRPLIVLVPD
jgi:hypothetical protein